MKLILRNRGMASVCLMATFMTCIQIKDLEINLKVRNMFGIIY